MKNLLIILNPVAGRGASLRALPQIESTLVHSGVQYEICQTIHAGQGIELARQAADRGYDVVAAAGGDGTLNEVINGLMAARMEGKEVPALGVLPVGRGNDFAFSMGVPMELEEGIRALCNGHRRSIDVGRLSGGKYPQGRFFGNGIGIGFDAMVTIEASTMTRLSGFTNYFVALLKSLILHFNSPLMEVDCDGTRISHPMMMVSIMNGRRLGGGFMVAPQGSPSDGKFNVSIVRRLSRPAAMALVMRFIKGTQAGHPALQTTLSRKIKVTALTGSLPAHGDGEIFSTDSRHLEVELLPSQLELVTGPVKN